MPDKCKHDTLNRITPDGSQAYYMCADCKTQFAVFVYQKGIKVNLATQEAVMPAAAPAGKTSPHQTITPGQPRRVPLFNRPTIGSGGSVK